MKGLARCVVQGGALFGVPCLAMAYNIAVIPPDDPTEVHCDALGDEAPLSFYVKLQAWSQGGRPRISIVQYRISTSKHSIGDEKGSLEVLAVPLATFKHLDGGVVEQLVDAYRSQPLMSLRLAEARSGDVLIPDGAWHDAGQAWGVEKIAPSATIFIGSVTFRLGVAPRMKKQCELSFQIPISPGA